MSAETDLKTLLRSLSPILLEPRYVFCTIASGQYGDGKEAMPIASFQEREGLTLVVTAENAAACGLDYQGGVSLHQSAGAFKFRGSGPDGHSLG